MTRNYPMAASLLIALFLMALATARVQASAAEPVVIYYNRACADCLHYIDETVVPLLRTAGLAAPVYRDYVNEPANRAALLQRPGCHPHSSRTWSCSSATA
jgi:cytochrome c551/c552